MAGVLRKLLLIASLGLSAILWLGFYTHYFKWRGCFNELGRCFDDDSGSVFFEQSNLVWLPLAALVTSLCVLQIWLVVRQKRARRT